MFKVKMIYINVIEGVNVMNNKNMRVPYQTSFDKELIIRYRSLLREIIKDFNIDESFKIHTRKISLNSLLEYLFSLYTDKEIIEMAIRNRELRSKEAKKERVMVNTTFKEDVYNRIKSIGAASLVSENNAIEGVMRRFSNDELIENLLNKGLIERKG